LRAAYLPKLKGEKMDKYQQRIIRDSKLQSKLDNAETYNDIKTNGTVTLIQESVPKTKYKLKISCCNSGIEKINGQNETEIIGGWHIWEIDIDFDKKIKELKIEFANKIADDLIIKLNYADADKVAYEKEQTELKRQEIISAMKISHSTGDSLVNIYFQHCSENVTRTEISLFQKGGTPVAVLSEPQLIAKYKVDNEMMFKAITGLAYGYYSYQVEQFDADNNSIAKSDITDFNISQPYYYGGKNIVGNC
jgi:hypothetical protein